MRYAIPIGILLALVGALGAIKYTQISKLMASGEAMKKSGMPPEVVGTAVATEDSWEGTLSAVGSVAAVRGVAVSNEAPGVVTAIHFESGQTVKAGQILVELDTSVERAQLESLEARRDLAEVGADRSRRLAKSEFVAKAQLDGDEAQLKTSKADWDALKAQIERKTVRAPFGGRLGMRTVNLGQYLNPGTAVTMLESLGSVYVDFNLPQQQLPSVKVGEPVRITLAGSGEQLQGAIGAIDPTVDAISRTIKLRASVPNKQDKLRPGMFVNVAVVQMQRNKVITAPLTAIVHASYGDSVFVVEEKEGHKVARQQFVRLGSARGDFVAIADGVKPGQELVTAGAFKLRNGANITINNDIKPTPSVQPRVENL
jgi:membrane fusion protein (multidrug efflux system)